MNPSQTKKKTGFDESEESNFDNSSVVNVGSCFVVVVGGGDDGGAEEEEEEEAIRG